MVFDQCAQLHSQHHNHDLEQIHHFPNSLPFDGGVCPPQVPQPVFCLLPHLKASVPSFFHSDAAAGSASLWLSDPGLPLVFCLS